MGASGVVVAVCVLAFGAGVGEAKPRPAYTVSFAGSGSEHHVDEQQNIQNDGTCDSAEHVDVVASLRWSAGWTGFRPPARTTKSRVPQTSGSTIAGSDVKDACGLPLADAPAGWVGETTCDAEPVVIGGPQLVVTARTAKTLVLAVSAPLFSAPVSAHCPLNVRNDQLVAHVPVSVTRLAALAKGRSLTFAVGTAHPGPGDADVYAPSLDCSQPTKPYDGYRTADHCQDDLSWSGTLKIARVS